MPRKFAVTLSACCVAVALVVATAHAAETTPSLIGMTRDQVLAHYGEPKSQIAVGNRLIMFFERERVVVRDGIVVEVERLAATPVRRPAAAATPAPTEVPPAATSTPSAAPAAATTGAAPTAPVTTPAAATPVAPAPVSAPAVPPAAADASAASAANSSAGTLTSQPPPEPKLEIKLVRPPSANYVRPPTKEIRPAPSASPTEPTAPPSSSPAASSTAPVAAVTQSSPPVTTVSRADSALGKAVTSFQEKDAKREVPVSESRTTEENATSTPATPDIVAVPEPAVGPDTPAVTAEVAEPQQKGKTKKTSTRKARAGDAYEPDADPFTAQTYVIGFLVIFGGGGYLAWRIRQRQLELAATAVSRAPFSTPVVPSGGGGAVFNTDLISKLEWKRFEELVAAYYAKTGVVAVRTKSGPASPVHIKISWKGEPRPFACVQCIAHPTGLIDSKPLQDLAATLTAEDIRRGYVVSTGKFNVNARDFAEEKHITLLPGDIFIEKLNALPDSARSEIMQAITTGDYTTPSCPKCDTKMVRATDDPGTWRCPVHADQIITGRK